MANINNYGAPQIANKAFVPLAIEAGIEAVITSLVTLATTEKALVVAVKDALEGSNPELAAAWNQQTQSAVLDFLAFKAKTAFALVKDLPDTVNEPGPASVSAGRDGSTPTQVNISFSGPPTVDVEVDDGAGGVTTVQKTYKYAIYLDGLFQKVGNNTAVEGWVNDYLSDVAAGSHTIRVLFVTPDNAITLFGPIAAIA